jgi:hypothetical protein
MSKKVVVALVLVLVLCGCEAQRLEAETELTQAETQRTQAQTQLVDEQAELREAETQAETLEAFTGIIEGLLSELGNERRFQRESLREVTALLEQLGGLMTFAIVGNLVLTAALMLAVIIGSFMVVVALLRRKRQQAVVVPQATPWLPYEPEHDAIQVLEVGREILIE